MPPSTAARPTRADLRRRARRRTRGLAVAVMLVALVVAVLFVKVGSESPTSQPEPPPGAPATSPALEGVALGTDGVLPFAKESVWNAPVAADAALAPNSAALVGSFNRQWHDNYGTVSINTDDFSIPIYRVPAGQPTVKVSIAEGCNSDAGLLAQLAAVPIPADARPANGTDRSLVVWQPSSDSEWELWQAQRNGDGSWSACWGGRLQEVSKGQGVFPFPYGVAASGLSYLGGALKVSELEAGKIDHALAINVVHASASPVAPANRTDGGPGSEAIPEGTRFRLDPSIDVTTLGLPESGVAIARALQRYGMYVTDKSGAVVLMGESSAPYVAAGRPDPYRAIFGGLEAYQVLGRIPWDRLQVVAAPS